MVDLDGFKTINDTHGHHAGDLCIRHVADVIGRSVREGDWLCRWGGDEFVLALWDDSRLARLGLIDARQVREMCTRPMPPDLQLGVLYQSVACEVWLRSLERATTPVEGRR